MTSSLAGKRVLIARAEKQTEGPADLLRARGAVPVIVPCIVIGEPDDLELLKRALQPEALRDVDWVVFTSANGVIHTWLALGETTKTPFGAAKIAVVGSATEAALRERGLAPDLVAKEARGEGLAKALIPLLERRNDRAPRVLILRAQEASDVLPEALLAAGATVDVVPAYRTRASADGGRKVKERLSKREIDVVVFSSGSTVTSICDALGDDARALIEAVTVACLGPVTAKAARERGLRVDVVPAGPTFLAVIEALEIQFRAP